MIIQLYGSSSNAVGNSRKFSENMGNL